jgi:PAS domain S-box-containing protein
MDSTTETGGAKVRVVIYWVLGLGLIMAFLAFNWMQEELARTARDRFKHISQQVAISFERNLLGSKNALESIAVLFASLSRVSRSEFQTFVAMHAGKRTGVQALEWIPRVAGMDRSEFEAAARLDGLEGFAFRQIGEDGMDIAAIRAEYFPVFYVEPLAGNEKALGFDLASNPAHKAALEQARDSGMIVASTRIRLVQEEETQSGVVVFSPVYSGSKPPETVEERRRKLTGFGLGVFRIGDLLTSAITTSAYDSDLIISLYDVEDTTNPRPLHLVGIENKEDWPGMEAVTRGPNFQRFYNFGSRQWQLVIAPRLGTLAGGSPWLPWLSALAMFIIAMLMGSYLHSILRRREFAEDLVRIRTEDLQATSANLRDSEERITTIVDNVLEGLITIDDRGNVRDFNLAAERIFGYGADEVIGQNVKLLMPEPYLGEHDGYLHNYNTTGEAKILGIGREVEGLRKDGSVFPMDLGIAEMRVGGQRLFVGNCRDITERKRAERTIHERTVQLEAANSELDSFAYSVSHDLRAPLRAMGGFTRVLVEDHGDKLDGEAHDFLDRIGKASQRMGRMIDDILTLSHATRGEMTIAPVDLSEIAERLLAELSEAEPERDTEIAIQPGVVATGDRRLLETVLRNLLHNAWKFSGQKTQARIEFGVVYQEGGPTFFVRDNGVGFDMAYSEKLFGIFQRLHGRDEFEGTGIGLATVARLITRHGGLVWAEAAEGDGATFYFTLGA